MKKDERIIIQAIADCSALEIPCMIEISEPWQYPSIIFEKSEFLRSLIVDQKENIKDIDLSINMSMPIHSYVVIEFKKPTKLSGIMSQYKDEYETLELYMTQDFWKIILESDMEWEKEYLLNDIKEIVDYKCSLEWEDIK